MILIVRMIFPFSKYYLRFEPPLLRLDPLDDRELPLEEEPLLRLLPLDDDLTLPEELLLEDEDFDLETLLLLDDELFR
jgi:hypothetical protein